MNKYTSISIKKEFGNLIDKAIANNPRYMSRADFVRNVIIKELEQTRSGK